MAGRSVKGGEPHEAAVEADTGALGAVSGAGAELAARSADAASDVIVDVPDEREDVEELVALAELEAEEEFHLMPLPALALVEQGFVDTHEALTRTCLLGRRAVSATHKCLGAECMAWRPYFRRASDAPEKVFGYCGLAVSP